MRSTKHFAEHEHLVVRVRVDGEKVHERGIEDPFVTARTIVTLTFWEWLCLLFRRPRQIEVIVNVDGDGVATKRWFVGQDGCDRCAVTIGFPHDGSNADDPGYHHGKERLCEACYYGTPKVLRDLNPCGNSYSSSQKQI